MVHHHHHGHGHCHHGHCDIHSEGYCCCGETCDVHHHHEDHHDVDFAHQLIEMADEAWMEVLKEKIKEQIEASSGKHLDKLAKLVAEANNTRWKNKMANKKVAEGFSDKIHQFFNQ